MGGSTHIGTQNGWIRKKPNMWWQPGGKRRWNGSITLHCFAIYRHSAPKCFPFLPVCPLFWFLFALCSLLCLLFLLGSVCLCLWKPVRSRHYGAQIKKANFWSWIFRTFCASPLKMVVSCQKYELQKTLYFWDCTPSYGWKHPHRNPDWMDGWKCHLFVCLFVFTMSVPFFLRPFLPPPLGIPPPIVGGRGVGVPRLHLAQSDWWV